MSKKYQKNMLYVLESMENIISAWDNCETKNLCKEDIISECKDAIVVLEGNVEKTHVNDDLIEQLGCLKSQFERLCAADDVRLLETFVIIKKEIMDIKEVIKKMLQNYCEVLFLPYKVSMWDSLESVWKAAVEDEGVKAYVMPIPYFEKNEDGSLGVLHYEGGDFPSYVPIIDYRKFDLSLLKPDMIFIHNPYDQYNRVTSVHPDYYTTELKKYTDLLVYIPYYVSEECAPTNTESMKAREGFCMTPGVINSDITILQSENVKQLFVNILNKNMPNVSREHWEEKIWGLGSPKWDRVNAIQRDDQLLSSEWKNIIYKNDERKKVIFYNTSLKDLLQHEDMLEKIKDTLAFFKKNQDIALWWRPHPLYESTLESLRPHMLKEYRTIVKEYKEQQWGIFDDGVDLNWAIAETDAYYGDKSSVAQLFKKVDKPIMYQSVCVKQNEKNINIPIWPSAFCVDGDEIWFVHGKINALMKYNMKEEKTYFIATIPNESAFQEILYSGIYKWKSQIYMIPCWAREIAVYDDITGQIEKICLKNIELYNQKMLFCKVFAEEKSLYCVPYYYDGIIKVDMENREIENIVLNKKFDECINDATRFTDCIVAICQNKLFYVYLKDDRKEVKCISKLAGNFNHITSLRQEIVCSDSDSNFIQCFNITGEETKKTLIIDENIRGKISSLFNHQILIDFADKSMLKVISLEKDIKETIYPQKERSKSSFASTLDCFESGAFSIDNCEYYFNVSDCTMIKFMNSGEKKFYDFSKPSIDFMEYKKYIKLDDNKYCFENEIWKLEDWSKSINNYYVKEEKKDGTIGSAIWKRIRRNI